MQTILDAQDVISGGSYLYTATGCEIHLSTLKVMERAPDLRVRSTCVVILPQILLQQLNLSVPQFPPW